MRTRSGAWNYVQTSHISVWTWALSRGRPLKRLSRPVRPVWKPSGDLIRLELVLRSSAVALILQGFERTDHMVHGVGKNRACSVTTLSYILMVRGISHGKMSMIVIPLQKLNKSYYDIIFVILKFCQLRNIEVSTAFAIYIWKCTEIKPPFSWEFYR